VVDLTMDIENIKKVLSSFDRAFVCGGPLGGEGGWK
jgi:hypothetical protein